MTRQKINIVLVEDEQKEQDRIKEYLNRLNGEDERYDFTLNCFDSGEDFLSSYQSGKYQLCLMDIELKRLSGLQTSELLRQKDKNIVLVFVTNMVQYALSGYGVDAIDFAVKPLEYGYFVNKIYKAIRFIKKFTTVYLDTGEAKIVLSTQDITYIESDRHYLIYHTKDKNTYKIRGTMTECSLSLADYAFRFCNKCYLVNLDYVQKIEGDFVTVNEERLLISRRKKNEFINEFSYFMGGI